MFNGAFKECGYKPVRDQKGAETIWFKVKTVC